MAKASTFLGWVAGGTGIVLLYSAYKNQPPSEVLKGTLTGERSASVIDPPGAGATQSLIGDTGGDIFTSTPTQGVTGVSANDVARAQALKNRQVSPVWAPIPTQPNMLLDAMAVAAFLRLQMKYGKLLPLTGAKRSVAEADAGYASDPGRYAPGDKSLHVVGLAVDFNTNSVNVNDPKLAEALASTGWYRVGKSGLMHASYGVPG